METSVWNVDWFMSTVVVDTNQETVGDIAYGEPTHIYVAPGKTVTGYTPWSEHPDGALAFPVLDFAREDSLIAIADAITATSGNKFRGNKTFQETTLDLGDIAGL